MKLSYLFVFITLICVSVIPVKVNAQQKADTTQKKYADEKPAAFPGGIDGWRRYLEGNLKYPKKAQRKQIQGIVRVQMIVDIKGHVTEVKALNDPGGGLAAEAERVVKDGPNWIPAFQNGKNVTYSFVQMITFALQ